MIRLSMIQYCDNTYYKNIRISIRNIANVYA